MSEPRTLTLRPLKPGEIANRSVQKIQDCRWVFDGLYREVSLIPEGFEVCDLEDATKVLIGNTFLDLAFPHIQFGACTVHYTHFKPLGVLAIRPIPEPEPMSGDALVRGVGEFREIATVDLPDSLIGKTIRWEVIP